MKTKIMMMLIASAAVMTACSSDDPFENAYNYMDPGMLGPGGDMMTDSLRISSTPFWQLVPGIVGLYTPHEKDQTSPCCQILSASYSISF